MLPTDASFLCRYLADSKVRVTKLWLPCSVIAGCESPEQPRVWGNNGCFDNHYWGQHIPDLAGKTRTSRMEAARPPVVAYISIVCP